MKNILTIFSFCCIISIPNIYAQYDDYIGAGHDNGVIVTASSADNGATGQKTVSGEGMDVETMEAARFLGQATLGADLGTIQNVKNVGMEAWLDQQLNMPPTLMSDVHNSVHQEVYNNYLQNGGDPEEFFGPWALHFNYAWWQMAMTAPDLVRHRVALALSEILVISINSDLDGFGEALATYYDLLLVHAFGNYKDLLKDITLHVSMGYYLSHLNNPKSIPEENIHPDENFAREIMQLFTIGLYMLNQNGTRQTDGQGNFIPTYDNNDIKELAKVFTGLGPGAINENVDWTNEPYFGLGIWGTDMTVPMVMYPEWHEPGPKTLLGQYTIPGGQSGKDDICDAIDFLFNHQNVAPFISYRLIQRLVKSNPSPGYVSRIASVFNNNGSGVRGDLKAVIRAIFLDPEARDCSWQQHPDHGKLREPILRYTHAAKALPLDSPLGRYWNNGFSFLDDTKQHPLASPTVFNFFLPDHQPNGPIADNNLVAPEYKIHDSRTSIGFINQVNQWAVWNSLWWSWEENDPNVEFDLSSLIPMAEDPEVLINHLDILFTNGQLSDETRASIRTALHGLIWGDYQYDRARLGLYLILISPDYAVFR